MGVVVVFLAQLWTVYLACRMCF